MGESSCLQVVHYAQFTFSRYLPEAAIATVNQAIFGDIDDSERLMPIMKHPVNINGLTKASCFDRGAMKEAAAETGMGGGGGGRREQRI